MNGERKLYRGDRLYGVIYVIKVVKVKINAKINSVHRGSYIYSDTHSNMKGLFTQHQGVAIQLAACT